MRHRKGCTLLGWCPCRCRVNEIQLSFLALLKVQPVVMVFSTVNPATDREVTPPPTHHLNLYLTLKISLPIAYIEVSTKPGLLMENT